MTISPISVKASPYAPPFYEACALLNEGVTAKVQAIFSSLFLPLHSNVTISEATFNDGATLLNRS